MNRNVKHECHSFDLKQCQLFFFFTKEKRKRKPFKIITWVFYCSTTQATATTKNCAQQQKHRSTFRHNYFSRFFSTGCIDPMHGWVAMSIFYLSAILFIHRPTFVCRYRDWQRKKIKRNKQFSVTWLCTAPWALSAFSRLCYHVF